MYQILKDLNIKTVAYNHGYYFLPYMYGEYLFPIALQRKEAYASADYVVWLTEIACNLYNIENKNGYYIPNPSPETILRARKGPNKKIVAVGRFDDAIKQIDKTLLVFKEIHALDPEYELDVVGYCPMDMKLTAHNEITLEAFIKTENIPVSNISFLGEQSDVNQFYDSAGFLLSTSKCEGFGMVFLEAFAHGLPCASFEYLGIDEIIIDGKKGALAPADDYQMLAQKIVAIISDKKTYTALSEQAIETAMKYSVESFYEHWDAMLDLALNDNGANIDKVKPKNALTANTYNKVIIEYDKLLEEVIKQYYAKEPTEEVLPPKQNKVTGIKIRFKESLARDGVYLTGEKIVRKAYSKTIKRR